jgi:hypothetical protein
MERKKDTNVTPTKAYVTVDDIASLFRVSPKSVYHWVASDPSFPFLRVGKSLRFDAARVTKYFEEKTESEKPSCFENPLYLKLRSLKVERSLKNRNADIAAKKE